MTRDELNAGWARLRTVYERMPELTPAIAREWLRVLEPFSGADLDTAISLWMAEQKFRPVPVDLAKYCRRAQARRQREAAEMERQSNGSCPWCGGLGYIGQFWEPDGPDKYFYCICAASPNPEKGAAILAQARADYGWIFDPRHHGFRQRRHWVGDPESEDDRPLPLTQQQAFWQGVNAALK